MTIVFIFQLDRMYDGSIRGELNRQILRFYDDGEAPDNLDERAQAWANHYESGIEVRQQIGDTSSTRTFYPKEITS